MERKYLGRALGLAVAACSLLGWAGLASADIVIETVPVGNAGNAADTAAHSGNPAGQGRVDYAYNIGKYEVTAGQYTVFLNAVAGVDTYSLYNSNMADTAQGSGITRTSGADGWVYAVDSAHENRPVNYVSFWDACRFANWLNNGQGNGDTETGAYTLTANGISGNTIIRNANWQWAVTSEDEWYKAAYYNPADGSYYLYPTSSNTAPGSNMADPRPGNSNANNYTGGAFPLDNPYYTTVVGEFQNSASPYGTFDQGGNVREWNEAIIGSSRGLRGGSFNFYSSSLLQSGYRSYDYQIEDTTIGFRVSQVPEPASLGILTLGVIGMVARRRVACR